MGNVAYVLSSRSLRRVIGILSSDKKEKEFLDRVRWEIGSPAIPSCYARNFLFFVQLFVFLPPSVIVHRNCGPMETSRAPSNAFKTKFARVLSEFSYRAPRAIRGSGKKIAKGSLVRQRARGRGAKAVRRVPSRGCWRDRGQFQPVFLRLPFVIPRIEGSLTTQPFYGVE